MSPSTSPAPTPANNPRALSLRLLILFVTCCAIILGLIWRWPGAAPIVIAAVAVALIRSATIVGMARKAGARWSLRMFVFSCFASLGVVALAAFASASVFIAVCFPLGATQNPISEPPPFPLLYGSAWIAGGAAAAIVATAVLDLLWLRPLAQGYIACPKDLTRGFLRTAIPLICVFVVGGLFSLAPGVITAISGPLSTPRLLAGYAAATASLIGGGCVGALLAQNYPKTTAGLAAFVVGNVAMFFLLRAIELSLLQDPYLAHVARGFGAVKLVLGVVAGLVSVMAAISAIRWTERPD